MELERDEATIGANGNVGIPSVGPIGIHETVGRSVPGPAGAWLDQGWYTGPDGHRLSNGAVTALLNKHAGTGSACWSRPPCSTCSPPRSRS